MSRRARLKGWPLSCGKSCKISVDLHLWRKGCRTHDSSIDDPGVQDAQRSQIVFETTCVSVWIANASEENILTNP